MVTKNWKLIVSGSVQGVSYRAGVLLFVYRNLLPVKGYVKNLSTGCVEVVIQGEVDDLKKVEDYCFEGSKAAKVFNVEKVELHSIESLSDFKIDY